MQAGEATISPVTHASTDGCPAVGHGVRVADPAPVPVVAGAGPFRPRGCEVEKFWFVSGGRPG